MKNEYLEKISKFFRKIRKVFKPPKFLTDDSKAFYSKRIAQEWRELIYLDMILIMFLLASAHQLAYFFEGGKPGFFAWVKAIGFDGAIALFSRNVSRAAVLKEKTFATWAALITLMLITVAANVGYEWLIEKGQIGIDYVVTDPLKNIRALIISGSLSIIILGISAVRAVVARSFDSRRKEYAKWIVDEERRVKRNEYMAGYQRKRRGKRLV